MANLAIRGYGKLFIGYDTDHNLVERPFSVGTTVQTRYLSELLGIELHEAQKYIAKVFTEKGEVADVEALRVWLYSALQAGAARDKVEFAPEGGHEGTDWLFWTDEVEQSEMRRFYEVVAALFASEPGNGSGQQTKKKAK